VSAPCTWDEAITGEIGPRSLTLKNVPARVAEVGDLWADMRRRKRSLAPAIAKLTKLVD
jgi:bifunctional non-homologous end joining protein LigD